MSNSPEKIFAIRHRKEQMISFLKENPDQFDNVINISMSDKPYAWRAAWLIGTCMRKNDLRIQPYLKATIKSIATKGDGHQRELLKILAKMDIPKDEEGALFNACIGIWANVNKSPSVRITAYKLLVEAVKKYPELKNELELLSQDYYTQTLSPGIKKSFEKINRQL